MRGTELWFLLCRWVTGAWWALVGAHILPCRSKQDSSAGEETEAEWGSDLAPGPTVVWGHEQKSFRFPDSSLWSLWESKQLSLVVISRHVGVWNGTGQPRRPEKWTQTSQQHQREESGCWELCSTEYVVFTVYADVLKQNGMLLKCINVSRTQASYKERH